VTARRAFKEKIAVHSLSSFTSFVGMVAAASASSLMLVSVLI
jgi:hypothetical protein